MADYHPLPPRSVYIDKEVTMGCVELPTSYIEESQLRAGHDVILVHGDRKVKVMVEENDLLKSGEMAVSPGLALYLGVEEGQELEVMDRYTLGERLFDDMDHFVDTLEKRADHLKDFIETDWDRFMDHTVKDLLTHLVHHPEEQPDYLVVAPNPDDFGVDKEEVYQDPSKDEKVWTPDEDGDGEVKIFNPDEDGDGEVRIFRPGGEEEEEED